MLCNRDSFFFFFYVIASSLSFMDTCSFELENICGMIQSSDDNSDWQRLSQVPAGPNTDHTNMGECKGMRKKLFLSLWEVFSADACKLTSISALFFFYLLTNYSLFF